MSKAFASQADLAEKRITFADLGGGAYAYTAEGDPNSGVVVGDDGVMVLDTQATPVMAQDVIERIRGVTDQPIHGRVPGRAVVDSFGLTARVALRNAPEP